MKIHDNHNSDIQTSKRGREQSVHIAISFLLLIIILIIIIIIIIIIIQNGKRGEGLPNLEGSSLQRQPFSVSRSLLLMILTMVMLTMAMLTMVMLTMVMLATIIFMKSPCFCTTSIHCHHIITK